MTIKDCYEKMNGNYAEAFERFQMDKLIERFMLKFPADGTYATLMEAVKASDIEASFKAVHTLKGLAANLSFEALRQAASNLTEQLRPLAETPDPVLVAEVEKNYKLVIDTLSQYEAEKQ